MARPEVKREYAAWLATPPRLRTSLGLPATQAEFADDKGMSPRTMRRWQDQEDFQLLVEQRRVEIAKGKPGAAVEAVGPPRPAKDYRSAARLAPAEAATWEDDPAHDGTATLEEQRYLRVKDTLASMAADGNQGAIDLYLKHYGRGFIEAEQSDNVMFATMTDGDLVAAVLPLIGVEAVSSWLADRAVEAAS